METFLRIRCRKCGQWNRMKAEKVFLEQSTSEEKVKAYIPMYRPVEVTKCSKCGNVIGSPDELIRIIKQH